MNKYIVLALSFALVAVIALPVVSDSVQAGNEACPPGTPTGIGGAGVIHLTWTPASVAPTYYVLYWSNTSGAAQDDSGPLYVASYDLASVEIGGEDVSPVPPATTLYFQVGAYYEGTCKWIYSGWSGPISTPDAPGAPTGLAAAYTADGVALSWTAPASDGGAEIIEYQINRAAASGEEVLYDTIGPATSYLDDDVEAGQTYYYTVTACNGYLSSPSNEAVATAGPFAPDAPENLQTASGPARLTLSWDAPSDDGGAEITAYYIYGGSSGEDVLLGSTNSTTTSWTHQGLTNGQEYFYRITAVNAFGESAPSNEASAIPIDAPSAPTDVSAAGGLRNITVVWSAPGTDHGSAVLGHRVHIRDGTSFSLSADAGLALSYAFDGLDNGTEYFVTVQAYNAAGDGERSDEVSDSTLYPPGAPVATIAAGENWINVTWSVPSSEAPILGYKLYRGTGADSLEPYRVLGDVQYYEDASLVSGTYCYSVVAFSDAGDSALSNTVSAALSTVQMSDIGDDDNWPWILLALIIVGAAILFLMLLRRRSQE